MSGTRFIIIFVLILILFYLINSKSSNLVYQQSDIDDQPYLVRDLEDKDSAANMLSRIKKNINDLSDYLYENKSKYPEMEKYIDQLHEKIKNTQYSESTENSSYTSYSVNKGEQIVFCIRSKRNNKIHDLNLIMYVALHEAAHVANPEYGHGDLFKRIFAFLTTVGIEQGYYKKINFEQDPTEYCGLTISESII